MTEAATTPAEAPLYQREFPDFDAATMPFLASVWKDQSWHNDTCPSFFHEEFGLIIFIDYADKTLSEFPESPRFSLSQMVKDTDTKGEDYWAWPSDLGDDKTESLIISSDDWAEVEAHIMAEYMVHQCARDLKPAEWAVVQSGATCLDNMPYDTNFFWAEGVEFVRDRAMILGGDEEEGAQADADLWNAGHKLFTARFPEPDDVMAKLSEVFVAYLKAENITEEGDAIELLMSDEVLSPAQREWVSTFVTIWEKEEPRNT
jgi:hypothetical protein